ncbi:MAG: hypothetical protein MZU97_19840 [Bacillus subtilis]|nr:hypothetical protein [Bacillus subtilis]
MNDIVNNNRLAWEASFEHRSEAFERRTIELVTTNPKALFSQELAAWLEATRPEGKTWANVCSNNGRETLGALALCLYTCWASTSPPTWSRMGINWPRPWASTRTSSRPIFLQFPTRINTSSTSDS